MKLTIFTRLIIGYLAIIVLIIGLGVYAFFRLNQVNQIINSIISVDDASTDITTELKDYLLTQLEFEEKFFVLKDQDFYMHFWKSEKYFPEAIGKLNKITDTSYKRSLVNAANIAYNMYLSLFRDEAKSSLLSQDYNEESYIIYKGKREKLVANIDRNLKELVRTVERDRLKKTRAASKISIQVIKVTTATVAIAVLMVIVITIINTRSINRPILLLKEKTKEVAKGRYPKTLAISSPPEIGELTTAFDAMCERLKELDDLKIDFISHISHKLRTPLTAIQEASAMLLEGVFADMPEKQHQLFMIIKDECKRLIDEVNRILDLSRMEAKMMDYHFEVTDILPIVKMNVLKLSPLAQKRGIEFTTNLTNELSPANIDQDRIIQVVEELLGNALKFTPEKGKIIISALINNKGMIEISVTDTGYGIPEKELELVFEKFKRIESGRASERGSGLGLSIAKHIITVHGGQIWAESKHGKGSTFSFTLPALS
ncbi:MAG: HAMP domain-containing protein [Proteobacteria bacterium]|nr:HAMP domain-containing protein [Pseudomonadota bacterium]